MSTAVYKVFDGGTWKSICDCNLKIQKNGTWETINPKTCNVKAWTGTEWCRVVCPCNCPSGYTYNIDKYQCESVWTSSPAVTSGQTMYDIIFPTAWSSSTHGALGVVLYDDITSLPKPVIGFPTNTNPGGEDTLGNWSMIDNNGIGNPVLSNVYFNDNALGGTVASENRVYTAGIWATNFPNNEWLNVNYCLTNTQSKQVIIAAAADNQIWIEIKFDSQATFTHIASLYTENVSGNATNEFARQTFKYMHLFPITLPAGTHIIRISGMNISLDAGMSVEIYDITRPNILALMAANNAVPNSQPINPYIIFSTKNLILPPGQGPLRATALTNSTITYDACPIDQTLDTCNGLAMCKALDIIPCNGSKYSNLEINIWYDNSGSMNDTLSPLQEMAATNLKNCLLPYYGNDLVLYNERIKIFNMFNPGADPNLSWDYNERFIKCFSTGRNFQRTPDLTVSRVINLTFSDESDPYGYGTTHLTPFNINDTRTTTYDDDVLELRNKLASVSYSIKGHNFIVNTLTIATSVTMYPNYINFATAVLNSNTGSYTVPNSLFDLNAANKFKSSVVDQGSTAAYYKNQVMAVLQVLLNENASFINC